MREAASERLAGQERVVSRMTSGRAASASALASQLGNRAVARALLRTAPQLPARTLSPHVDLLARVATNAAAQGPVGATCTCGGTILPGGECTQCLARRLRSSGLGEQEVARAVLARQVEAGLGPDAKRAAARPVWTSAPGPSTAHGASGSRALQRAVSNRTTGRVMPGEPAQAEPAAALGQCPSAANAPAGASRGGANRRRASRRVSRRSPVAVLARHPNDLVAYIGGSVAVFKAGTLVYRAPAVSGHPGRSEWEVNVGPTPTGMYVIRPGITRKTATTSVRGAVCGVRSIASGYQEITSTDKTPCAAGSAHYCNIPCPTAADPAQKCWTPRDCWGPKRIRIEGTADVATPTGGKQHRDGFYLHGGNRADAVSSGCIKSLDDDVFERVRELSGIDGRVDFCVGTACPEWAVNASASGAITLPEITIVGDPSAPPEPSETPPTAPPQPPPTHSSWDIWHWFD